MAKEKIYLPPLTQEGLKKRIEELIKDQKDGKIVLENINKSEKMTTVWNLAIQLSFIVMGGNSKQKGGNTI